ncbi:hypothetical protein D3C77_640660 [compost metagenome]
MYKPYCNDCSTELMIVNIRRLTDVDGARLGYYCSMCFPALDNEIKSKRFVEEYKGNKIYMKDECFYPYWECQYFFKSLLDVRNRIDNSHLAYVDPTMFHFINSENNTIQ